ncbi:transposase [Wolbachia endosymbiont of Nasonia giraulti]|uniref:transposase n=1 Tax=Wolbachia endosymbiont of Nasonia giraulti TaxID=180838 RepID=UPI003A8A0968
MTEYDKGKHTVFYHRYHIVWITKYRYRVLTKAMKERIRTIDLFRNSYRQLKIVNSCYKIESQAKTFSPIAVSVCNNFESF